MSEGVEVRRILTVLVLIIGLVAPPVFAQNLVTGLSFEKVEITSDFTGNEIVVFGTIDLGQDNRPFSFEDYDIVVVIEGPGEPGVVRKKQRTAGIWINREGREFRTIPGSYLVMRTKNPEEENFSRVLQDHNIGFENLNLGAVSTDVDAAVSAQDKQFRDAIVRIKKSEGLYHESDEITIIGDRLFSARFQLPAIVPVGIHQVRTYLFSNNRLVAGATHAIRVSKSGFEQILFRFARDYGFLYGAACVLLAMLTGWLGSVIFRRD
ncbi:MAG: TIGR02186 family protein [Pseudomonadota bacterium]